MSLERRPDARGGRVSASLRAGRVLLCGFLLPATVAACAAPATRPLVARAGRPQGPTTASATAPSYIPASEAGDLTTRSAPVGQPGWTPVSDGSRGIAVDQRTVTVADGRSVVVTRFRFGQVAFDLHVGSTDPPVGSAVIGPDAAPQVSARERQLLLAAFNGGFKAGAGAGGIEIDQQVLEPLVVGAASLVIDTDGVAHIGRWGVDLPYPREHVASVRQNLAPLVVDSVVSPDIADIGAWGLTIGGQAAVARSAAGEDGAGDILYAAGMQVLPIDLADALVSAGATSAMQLDINPEWVQLALARAAGGPLSPGVPGQSRPADQYLVGWTRDFVAVLAR